MITRLLRAELRRSALISTALALLVGIATALFAGSAALTVRTLVAIDEFWAQAIPPSLVQMHTGEIDTAAIDAWAASRDDVVDHQVITTLPVPVEALTVAGADQAGTVLEPALVRPSEGFDLLLDEDGEVVRPGPGQIALPVHYRAEGLADIGDRVRIETGGVARDFTVSAFARDAQMNPSLVTSKRMVVSDADYRAFEGAIAPEYLIELRLAPDARSAAVRDAYEAAGLPTHGVAVDDTIFRLMNGLSAMLIAATALLVAAAFMVISALALRYAFLAAMDEDVAEIAVLKAIGAPRRALRNLFLAKYALLAGIGAGIGLLASYPLTAASSGSMNLYLGEPAPSLLLALVPVTAAAIAGLGVVAFCALMMRRLDRLSPVTALRTGSAAPAPRGRRRRGPLRLATSRLGVHGHLALTGVLRRATALPLIVVAACALTMIVPASVLSTVTDARIATYLGIGPADVRLDMREGGTDLEALNASLDADPDVAAHTELRTTRVEVLAPGDEWESVVVEHGDHSAFPLRFTEGRAPTGPSDIALSVNEASELKVALGDTVRMRDADGEHPLTLVGVYQDITNGGRTAKRGPVPVEDVLWRIVYIDVAPGADPEGVAARLHAGNPGTKVAPIAVYTDEIMGAATEQMRGVTWLASISGLALAGLITALFAILVATRERGRIAALKAVGASDRGLIGQYTLRFALIGVLGAVLGAVGAGIGGQALFRLAMGSLGAPGVVLLPNPWLSWLALPAAVALVVILSARLALGRIRSIRLDEQE